MPTPAATSIDADLLKAHLAEVVEHENELTDELYERLFRKRPDAKDLFGMYSRANQQRMMSETLGAVLHILDQEAWLGEYVHAMGSRHQFSYETPTDMYEPYLEALIEALAHVSGQDWTPSLEQAWRAALTQVNRLMTDGYVPARAS